MWGSRSTSVSGTRGSSRLHSKAGPSRGSSLAAPAPRVGLDRDHSGAVAPTTEWPPQNRYGRRMVSTILCRQFYCQYRSFYAIQSYKMERQNAIRLSGSIRFSGIQTSRAFTLIELLVTIAVIGILVASLAPEVCLAGVVPMLLKGRARVQPGNNRRPATLAFGDSVLRDSLRGHLVAIAPSYSGVSRGRRRRSGCRAMSGLWDLGIL
jgi:prepilin-type N-terminal cleavage/methylation domain-containing protein